MRRIAALFLALSTPVHADTLVDHVDGLTVDVKGNVERFTGMLIDSEGRVVRLLRRGEKRPARVDYMFDGKGRVALPGMIDSHVRLMDLGLSLLRPGDRPAGEPRPEDLDMALVKAQQFLLGRGITAVADMGTTIQAWQSYRRAGDAGSLRLRIMGYAEGIENMALIGGPGPTPWLYGDRLRLNGVMLKTDGAIEDRSALLKTPYSGTPAGHGAALLDQTQFRNLMSRAAMDRFQIAVRATGDRANADALAAIEELAQTYKGERRWRIEQAVMIDPADFGRFGISGVIASMQPGGLKSVMAVAESGLGPQRLAGVHAWHSLSRAGAVLAFGSGAPARMPDPFGAIAIAISRQNEAAQPFGGWQPQELLTREAALAAWTASAAFAGFAEGRFGRLARGERADFLIIDRDPLLASPSELRTIKVQEVWIGGQRVVP